MVLDWDGTLPASTADYDDGTPRPVRYFHIFYGLRDRRDIDVTARVFEISSFFKVPVDDNSWSIEVLEAIYSEEFEVWLDEFKGYVESMDMAHELHSIDHLVPLFHHVLYYPHAGIRAKAAEVVTVMVQNNPSSQQLVMEVNGLQPLLYNCISDPDATSRTKALGAISALIRNNQPGITAFRLANGYAALRDALRSESVTLQREALNLIQYLLHENSSDFNVVTELRFSPIMMHLTSSDDRKVREAALRGLIVLAKDEEAKDEEAKDEEAKDEGGNNGQLVKYADKLKNLLQGRRQVPQEWVKRMIDGINAMAPEDLSAAREERRLMDSLWNVCYKKDKHPGFGGPLVFPGEDAPACLFTSTEPNQPRSLFPILPTAPNQTVKKTRTVPNRLIQFGSSILFGSAKYIRFGR